MELSFFFAAIIGLFSADNLGNNSFLRNTWFLHCQNVLSLTFDGEVWIDSDIRLCCATPECTSVAKRKFLTSMDFRSLVISLDFDAAMAFLHITAG